MWHGVLVPQEGTKATPKADPHYRTRSEKKDELLSHTLPLHTGIQASRWHTHTFIMNSHSLDFAKSSTKPFVKALSCQG